MATLVEALAERTSAQRVPIPGGVPAGTDLSFDPDFSKVKAEIDKLTSMSGVQPNWREVIDTSESLLATKTKDLRLATWVAVAKMNHAGWQGFAEGLTVYAALVKDYWDTMFPEVKRARGRANLYLWLGDQLAIYFDPKDVTASEGEAVRVCDDLLKEIDTLLAEKLGDLHPGPGKIRGTMRTKVASIPAEQAAPPPVVEAPAASAQAAPAPAASAAVDTPSLSGGGADDAIQAVRACGKTVMEAARLLRRADPAQAWPYRIQRAGLWLAVQQPPPGEGGKTRLPPPPADVQKKIEAQSAGEKWLELLNTAEDATATSLYWLDLHRWVALAMDRLGANFMPAREVVGREVTSFLARFPALLDLQFSSGRPFADAGTKAWLEDEGKKWGAATGGGGSSAASAAASAEDEELAKRFEEARGMVSGGKVGDGLALAVALANRGADARMRFRAHLTVARFALEGGKPEIAKPVLEALLGQIDQYGLESWEPSLCATVYTYLLTSLKTAKGANKNPESIAKEGFLFDKLCRLDPAAALRLAGS